MDDSGAGSAPAGHDTTAVNRASMDFAGVDSIWLFGYGSLIYKVDFPYLERRPAAIRGWSRRFWQGSHDHRGTPEHPGRVVTLVRDEGALCKGMAYRVAPATFGQLDVREKNGYLRLATTLHFDSGDSAQGLVYIASPDNAAWLGDTGLAGIVHQIAGATGPSGSNSEYVFNLAHALREIGAADTHVFAVEAGLRELPGSS